MEKKIKNIFIEGPIRPEFIGEQIARHAEKITVGAHQIFLGQVRADEIDGKQVSAIDYTTYKEMALEQVQAIREEIIPKFNLSCLHVFHSLGIIATGQICFFVFASSPHRKAAMDGCAETVERVKKELPIWGKEIFSDSTHQWKTNLPL